MIKKSIDSSFTKIEPVQVITFVAAGLTVCLALWLSFRPQTPTQTPTASPSTTQQPTATVSPTPLPTLTPTPPSALSVFIKNNRAIISSMHEVLNEMIERALNAQFEIVEQENEDLHRKLLALKVRTPPSVIASDWLAGVERTESKLEALKTASVDHRNGVISADEFLNNFAPLRIELVALDDLLAKF
jgi:hypothetical protein